MKNLSIVLSFILISSRLFAADYSKIDEQSHYVPFQLTKPVDIARYLTRNLYTEEDKLRAIFYWTANTIRFDVKQIPGPDYRYMVSGERNFLKEVLDTHQGVCQHYAMLFDTLCHSVGIKSFFICGYTHQDKEIAPLSHAWNAVLIGGEYYCLDVTWSAGYIEDEKYRAEFHDDWYLIKPSKFIKTHVPFDPVWQLLEYPLTNDEILRGNFIDTKEKIKYNFTDSITALQKRDTLTSLITENLRIQQMGITNELINNYVYFNNQNIVQMRYNASVSCFNKAVQLYNQYVAAKNSQFNKTSIPEDEIKALLENAHKHTDNAHKYLKILLESNQRSHNNFNSLQSAIIHLKQELATEDEFVKRYIKTLKPLRMLLFTKQGGE